MTQAGKNPDIPEKPVKQLGNEANNNELAGKSEKDLLNLIAQIIVKYILKDRQ